MDKLWPSVNKNYYNIRKYMLELFSLCGCERLGDEEPRPISVDAIAKNYYNASCVDIKSN